MSGPTHYTLYLEEKTAALVQEPIGEPKLSPNHVPTILSLLHCILIDSSSIWCDHHVAWTLLLLLIIFFSFCACDRPFYISIYIQSYANATRTEWQCKSAPGRGTEKWNAVPTTEFTIELAIASWTQELGFNAGDLSNSEVEIQNKAAQTIIEYPRSASEHTGRMVKYLVTVLQYVKKK